MIEILKIIVPILTAIIGLFMAIVSGTPVGSTIVVVDIVCFGFCKIISIIKK